MAGEKFFLVFDDQPNKEVPINEPINYGNVDFNLDQREGGMGRDVSLSGGKLNFRYTLYRHGQTFEKLLYYAHFSGFESDVKQVIKLVTGDVFRGELDFVNAETNDFNYFECPVIVESEMQIFRRRSETKVDLFSELSIDNENIEPLQPVNMLLQAKPAVQKSEWAYVTESKENHPAGPPLLTSLTQTIVQSDVKNTYVPFKYATSVDNRNDMKILTADSQLKNISIDIKGLDISVLSQSNRVARIFVYYGTTIETATQTIIYTQETNGILNVAGDLPTFNIGQLQRGDSIWLYLNTQTTGQMSVITKKASVFISATSTAYNSITPVFRLIDVMKQVSKSISGLPVYAPRFDVGGEFYDLCITNGNLLRSVLDKPFSISWDDIEKTLNPMFNADSEIQLDGSVFYGIEDDFYTTEECGFFPNTQFSGLVRKPNLLYTNNNFSFKFENYQALKENTEPNSESTIHGQSIFTPVNKKGESSRELSIKGVFDAILLDVQQRLSTTVSKDTSTQDDDKIFFIDTIATEGDRTFTESTNLQHTYDGVYLSLRSDGEVNFVVLGIKAGTTFIIQYADPNAGNYTVISVATTELILQRTSGGTISTANNGVRLTKYTYEIKQETIPLTNRTNQGFDVVLNLTSPDKYSNLRFSVQRVIKQYWNSFLATVNIYHKYTPIKNTYYKNNGSCETLYNGLRVVEKEDWIPTGPKVTPYMYENVVFANVEFSTFIALTNNIRALRGFIRTIDNNKRVLKLYPSKISYQNSTRQLTISGQEKYEKAYMTIVKKDGYILINDETRVRKVLYDKIVLDRDKKLILFDMERQRLYNGVYWDKISINDAYPETIEILKEWLGLL